MLLPYRGYPEGPGRGEVNKGHFSLSFPVFPVRLIQFHEKMTQLFGETVIYSSDRRSDARSVPGKYGLLHYSSGGSAGTGAEAHEDKGRPVLGDRA